MCYPPKIKIMKTIIQSSLKSALSYSAYKELMQKLISENSNTGEWSEERMGFTKLNFSRMKRMDAKVEISPEATSLFNKIDQKQYWLVLLESWCGDGAQTIPVLNKLAENSENIELKILLRDENPEMMELFLTNGSKSIPKLIIVDENLELLNTWGPRSQAAAKMVTDYKNEHGRVDATIKTQLQIWYNQDKGRNIISELVESETKICERLTPNF